MNQISIVAAISQNNCIGKNGELPWNIPEDMLRVKKLTVGRNVIMGRKTWESIPEKYRPLPKRKNIVITRNLDYPVPMGVEVYASIHDAIGSHKDEEIVGFGGQRIFTDMMPMADTLYITHVDQEIDACDAFFPTIDLGVWEEIERDDFEGFSFVTYVRNTKTTK
jgi:dihydrofolate reductase